MSHQVDARRMLDERGYSGQTIHNTNPLYLLEKPVRDRINDSYYYKEQCFAINEATLCDRAVEMTYLGGTYGQQKPTAFLCLIFKLLELLPDRNVVLYYLHQQDFKYLSALAAFYVRLTFDPVDVYKTLEPLLADYRKLRRRLRDGSYALTHMDEFVDDLLTKERVCGTALRKLPARTVLEDLGQLEERESPLGEEIEALDRDSVSGDDELEISTLKNRDDEVDDEQPTNGNGHHHGSESGEESG
jgi:pre-mRNA-splicing factor 38A